jgi:hypothetical protein
MRIIAACLVTLMVVGSARSTRSGQARADGPATEPAYSSFYTCQIKTIGTGVLEVHTLRGHSGIIHTVNVDDKTIVIGLDGRVGKLGDLKVDQWIKAYWLAATNNPEQQRLVEIEPGMPSWAAQRLADLEKEAASLDVAITLVSKAGTAGESLHLIGPDHKDEFKEPTFARLTKEEMTRLLRYLGVEGFLAEAQDGKNADATPKPPTPPYVTLSVSSFYQNLSLKPDCVARLEGIKGALPENPSAKLAALVAKVKAKMGGPVGQPPADPLKHAEGAVPSDPVKPVDHP